MDSVILGAVCSSLLSDIEKVSFLILLHILQTIPFTTEKQDSCILSLKLQDVKPLDFLGDMT